MVCSPRVTLSCFIGVLVACGSPRTAPSELAAVIVDAAAPPDAAVDAGGGEEPAKLTTLVAAPGNLGGLAIDDAWLYWIDATHGLARMEKRGGGAIRSLVAPGAAPRCCGVLAVDAANVYWAVDVDGMPKGLRRTGKSPTADPAAAPAAAPDSAPDAAIDPASTACLTVDADAVYWLRLAHGNDWARGGAIVRVAKRGGARQVLGKIATPGFGCIAVDSSQLYLTAVDEHRNTSAVHAVPKTGGHEKTIAPMTGFGVFLRVDDEQVYWAEAGGIMRARKTGGARMIVTELPKPCTSVAGMALDGADVFFTCSGFGPREDSGTVWRVGKRGGTPLLLAEHQLHPFEIAVDHDFVYWSNQGSQRKANADGTVQRLAKPAASP